MRSSTFKPKSYNFGKNMKRMYQMNPQNPLESYNACNMVNRSLLLSHNESYIIIVP